MLTCINRWITNVNSFLQSLDETRTSMKILEENRLNGKTLTYKDNKNYLKMRAGQHHHSKNQPIID